MECLKRMGPLAYGGFQAAVTRNESRWRERRRNSVRADEGGLLSPCCVSVYEIDAVNPG